MKYGQGFRIGGAHTLPGIRCVCVIGLLLNPPQLYKSTSFSKSSHAGAFVSFHLFLSLLAANSGSETNGLAEETVASGDYVPSEPSRPYLAGPMVIRVYPDGRPVPEDQKRPLPKDEDADELRYSRLPSIEEIEAKSGSMFYGKGTNEPSIAKRRMSFTVDDKNHRRPEVVRLRGHSLPYERVFRGTLNERRIYYWGDLLFLLLDMRYFPVVALGVAHTWSNSAVSW